MRELDHFSFTCSVAHSVNGIAVLLSESPFIRALKSPGQRCTITSLLFPQYKYKLVALFCCHGHFVWLIPFILWWNISIMMGVVSSNMTPPHSYSQAIVTQQIVWWVWQLPESWFIALTLTRSRIQLNSYPVGELEVTYSTWLFFTIIKTPLDRIVRKSSLLQYSFRDLYNLVHWQLITCQTTY